MTHFTVFPPEKPIRLNVKLPASKSISNRLLIMQYLSAFSFSIQNLSDAKDSQVLKDILIKNENEINVGHAGTCMRFLCALFAITEGEKLLTGSERMKSRPIKNLVEALKKLGAEIEYTEKEGFPPLKIKGKKITLSQIEIDASISSQFISALMMIGPYLENGLKISLIGQKVSNSYIEMTQQLMKNLGINVDYDSNIISIKKGFYTSTNNITVEPDWSSASFWYEIAALSKNSEILLENLTKTSVQGDKILIDIFSNLGVETIEQSKRILLKNVDLKNTHFNYDFVDCPDLAQPVAATMCALKITGRLTGLETLNKKESERVKSLCSELKKLNAEIISDDESFIEFKSFGHPLETPIINTFEDHRIAMSFAPLCLLYPGLEIEDPEVVSKSYPSFWNDLKQAGFQF